MSGKPKRRIYLREFRAISHTISTYSDFNLLIKYLVEGITRSFSVKGCSILILDERENRLVHVRSYGISDEYLTKGPILLDDRYSAFVTGEPVFVEDFRTDRRVQYPDAAQREGIASMLSVPIKHRGEVIGLVRVYHSEPWTIHEDDLDSFCILAEHLGLAIENNGLRNFLDQIKTAMESLPLRMLKGL